MVIDIVRSNQFLNIDDFLTIFVSNRTDVAGFAKINWKGHSSVVVNSSSSFGERNAVFWRNMLDSLNRADLGMKSRKIRNYCTKQIEEANLSAERERLDDFVRI